MMTEQSGPATLMAEEGLHVGHHRDGNGRVSEVNRAGEMGLYPEALRTPNPPRLRGEIAVTAGAHYS